MDLRSVRLGMGVALGRPGEANWAASLYKARWARSNELFVTNLKAEGRQESIYEITKFSKLTELEKELARISSFPIIPEHECNALNAR